MNTRTSSSIGQLVLEGLTLIGLAVMVPAIVLFDFTVLQNELEESSITEIVQELLLLASLLLMLWRSKTTPEARGVFVLAAGFFASLLIREFDFVFDRTPISWAWVVSIIVLASLSVAWKERKQVVSSLISFGATRSYAYFIVGFVMLIVFSRLFGSGGFMWQAVMGDAYTHVFKTVIQEGLEFFGYSLMGFGLFTSKAADWVGQSEQQSVTAGVQSTELGFEFSEAHSSSK